MTKLISLFVEEMLSLISTSAPSTLTTSLSLTQDLATMITINLTIHLWFVDAEEKNSRPFAHWLDTLSKTFAS